MYYKYYMADEIISIRIGRNIREKMRLHTYINWSAVIRKALSDELEKMHSIDRERAEKAAKDMDKIRKSGVFDGEKTGAEIIREWRDRRK
jgi:Arc/MetJ-type ribon-helix-helix transcriptional regulator